MIYSCDRCRAALPGGVTTCPSCGRVFDQAVPNDVPQSAPGQSNFGQRASVSEDPVDALLRDRTAASSAGTPTGGNAAWSSAEAPNLRQAAGRALAPPTRRVPVWLGVAAGLAAVVGLLTALGLGANALWQRGAGGEAEYRQHNFAGNAAAERGDFAQADREYGQMIALRPRRVDGYLLRAINEALEGQTTAAIADNTQALLYAKDPEMRGDLLYNRAEAYAKQSRYVKAIADFTQASAEYALERSPRQMRDIPKRQEGVYSLRADAYWHHKDYALSIKDSKAAIALGHVHPDDYGIQAKAEMALNQDSAASADFTQALRLDPMYLDGYVGLGDLAEKHHQYAQAVQIFQQATSAAPSNAQFWGSLGWFQYKAGQGSAALVSDRHSQGLDPNQAWVNYNLALTYAAAGQSAEAHAAYTDALASGGAAEQKAGMTDIREALAKEPASAALRAALVQVQTGRVGGPRPARALLPPPPIPAPVPPPVPPARFAALLGPEVALAGGTGIQPPLGYTLTQHPVVTLSSTSTLYLWSGPRRPDGTQPTLQVVAGHDDGSLAANSSERQTTQLALNDMGENHRSLRISPVSTASFGGLTFDFGDWDGFGTRTLKEYQGSEYWSVTPSHILHLSSHDAIPYSRVTLPLLQASIATFRRR